MARLTSPLPLLIAAMAFVFGPGHSMGVELAAMDPRAIVAQISAAVVAGTDAPVLPWLGPRARHDVEELIAAERAGHPLAHLETCPTAAITARQPGNEGTTLLVTTTCSAGTANWTLFFSDALALIDGISVVAHPALAAPVAADAAVHHGLADGDARSSKDASLPLPNEPAASAVSRTQHQHRTFTRPARNPAIPPVPRAAPAFGRPREARLRLPPLARPSTAEARVSYGEEAAGGAGQAAGSVQRPAERPASAPTPSPSPPPVADAAPAPPPPAAAPVATANPGPPDPRTVEFLLATTRKPTTALPLTFTADRSDGLLYGTVRVHVPDDHKVGGVGHPAWFGLFTLPSFFEQKLDEKTHFAIREVKLITEADFLTYAANDPRHEALVFVHGFNNSFEDSAYRFAQILYDLQYDRPAILFAWASKGSAVDYLYDKESADEARRRFAVVIETLHSHGVTKINVIAHSMGNYLAVVALADSADTVRPDTVEQLIMAAPDMPSDFLSLEAPKLRSVTHGMTLYVCATDRALMASQRFAGGVPRAGEVPADGPLLLPGIDTIDVSALGQDWLGINHDLFATNRSVMDDIYTLLNSGRPPPRLGQIRGMPEGATPPKFWRFQP